MKNFWKNHKLKIILVIYAVASALVIWGVLIPAVWDIENRADDIQKKRIDAEISQSRISQIPDMEKDYAGFESNQPAMDVILGAQDEVDFIKKLEAIAQETGNTISLQVNDLAAGSSAKNKKKDEDKSIREKLKYPNFISMSISLTGNYANLVNFIKKLENTPYYVNIISLDCKKEVETSEKKVAVEPTSQVGIFMPGGNPAPAPERIISEQEEVLNSILSVVIYTK